MGDCLRVHCTSGDLSGARGYVCEKRFNTYYGLSKAEPQALKVAHDELQTRGWSLTLQDDNSIEAALENYAQNKPVHLIYSNSDNLWATMTTYSLPLPAKCNGDSACIFAQKDSVKSYDVLLVFRTIADNQ